MLRENATQTSRKARAHPFRLQDLSVYPDRCVVQGSEGERHLEPKVMALLVQLASQPNEVVSRAKLLDAVWADVVVCDQVLTRCMSELRKALTMRSSTYQYIKTIPKKGYCLTCEPAPLGQNSMPMERMERLLHVELDTLVVMPLRMRSTNPSEDFLGTGFSRDLTQLLSLIPGLRVVASSSAEHGARESPDPVHFAQQLGARYVVCGAIEYRGPTFRIRLELIDAQTSEQLWANRYDEQISDFFAVQDELVQQIARSLSSALALGKVQHIQAREAFDLSCYERIQLAEDARRNYSRETAEFIVENMEVALAAQPGNAVAHALLAMQFSQNLVSGWCESVAQTRQRAATHLQTALRIAPNDAQVLMAAGIAALMRGEHAEAVLHLERSLEKNPNEAHALAEYGTARFYVTRELGPSIAFIEQAEQAAPQHPRFSIWAYRRGICYYEAGDYAAAIKAFDEGVARTPNYHHIYLTKALALIANHAPAEAKKAVALARLHAPDLACEDYLSGVRSFGLTVTDSQSCSLRDLWTNA